MSNGMVVLPFLLIGQYLFMLYALWSLLNLGLLIFFVYFCFRAARLLWENLGRLASLVFVFGLLSFIGHQNNTKAGNNQVKKWSFNSANQVTPGTIYYKLLVIDNMATLTIDLGVQYGRDTTLLKPVPIEANSGMAGFVSGYQWEPNLITVRSSPTTKNIEYLVSGLFKWNLLGVTIYNQPKSYSGFTNLESRP